ncbi:MAG: pilus assembly protein PilM [Nitrospiraceae bacterium]|nr:pilus assembly protein PilM [Nitrospiraceae bacterium]
MKLAAKVAVVEFVEGEVRLALVKTGGRRPKVLELHSSRVERQDDEGRPQAMADALCIVAGALSTKPAAVVLCVSSFNAIVRTITIPFRGARRVAAAVGFELERYLAFPIEELIVDFNVVREANGETEVLAVGIRRALLEERLSAMRAAGLDPDGIDVDAAGLTGLWRTTRPAMKGLNAVLHVRESGCILAIVLNKELIYFRHLDVTSAQVHENPATIARETNNSLRAFHGNWKGEEEVESLAVTGVGFFEDERRLFEDEINVPVTIEDLTGRLPGYEAASQAAEAQEALAASEDEGRIDHGARLRSNGWTALVGVALDASGAGNAFEFCTEDLVPKDKLERHVPYIMLTACLALLLLVGIAGFLHVSYMRNVVEAGRLREQIEAAEEEIAALESQGLNVPAEVFSTPSLLDILAEVGEKMPDDRAAIDYLRVDLPMERPGRAGARVPWITIMGEVKNNAEFDKAFSALSRSKLMRVDPDPGKVLDRGKTTFKITAHKPESGAVTE